MANINTELADAAARHQIYLERYGTSVVRDMLRILKRSESQAREMFDSRIARILDSGFDQGPRTTQRTNNLISDLAREIEAIRIANSIDPLAEALMSEWESFSDYENNFQTNTLNTAARQALDDTPFAISFAAVNSEQVLAAALAKPFSIQVGGAAQTLGDWVEGISRSERRRIEDTIRGGVINGETTRDITRRVFGTIQQQRSDRGNGAIIVTRRGTEALVRTAITHISSVARDQIYQNNEDLIDGIIWTSTLDSRTSSVCVSRDGNRYPVNEGPRPPAHVNCLSGDTNISTCFGVSNVYKRAYKGVMVEITTESGRNLTITPNHPVLTARGWVAAGDVNSLDKLSCVRDSAPVFNKMKDNVVSKFSDLFSACNVSSDSVMIKRPSAAKDFHGDISNSDVSIVNMNSLSWNGVRESILNDRENNRFELRSCINTSLRSLCGFDFLFNGNNSASNSFMGFFYKLGDLFRTRSIHPGLLLLRSISQSAKPFCKLPSDWRYTATQAEVSGDAIDSNTGLIGSNDIFDFSVAKANDDRASNGNASFFKNSSDWLITNAEDLADCFNADSVIGTEFDNVLDVSFTEFDGHVYNLENENNWYLSNGIITHNCRSSTVPDLKSYRDLGIDVDEPERSTRAFLAVPARMNVTQYRRELARQGLTQAQRNQIITNLSGQTDAQDFNSFLRRQTREFQETVLGVERTRLYRDGRLTLRQLIAPNETYHTLDELRRIHPSAFE